MTVHNATALEVDFASSNLAGAITDSIVLTKSKPCNFGSQCTPSSRLTVQAEPRPEAVSESRSKTSTEIGQRLRRDWRGRESRLMTVPPAQVAALTELYHLTGGPNWTRQANWLNGSNPCDVDRPWYGVSCARVTEQTLPFLWNLTSARGVTALHLASNNLVGTIPITLGQALGPSIQLLDLSSNLLTGQLPVTLLRGLPRLHTLYVEPKTNDTEFRLSGSLPADMGDPSGLPNLRYLGLSRNALSGPIPGSLGNLPCRTKDATSTDVACLLWLVDNNLNGTVPMGLCNASYGEVYLGGNPAIGGRRPCISVGYAQWPDNVVSPCEPCPADNSSAGVQPTV